MAHRCENRWPRYHGVPSVAQPSQSDLRGSREKRRRTALDAKREFGILCSLERHDENALIIYTDGSSKLKPRRGGWAYRLLWVREDGEEERFDDAPPGRLGATNNEMELTAAIEALRRVTGSLSPVAKTAYEKIVIYPDALYVVDHVHAAEHLWPGANWVKRDGEPVLNPDLWQELVRLKRRAGRVEFRHVKGHGSNPHNDAVDKLAQKAADLAREPVRAAPMVARKRSPRQTEPRAVPVNGQVETIRIISVRGIRGRPHHIYKYEVVTEDSPYASTIDDVFAKDGEFALRRNHEYEVRFGPAGQGRWLAEVLQEIERKK
jgi:ribonuclease HI